MARSSYIYVVLHLCPSCMTDLMVAFTVKYELKEWWQKCSHPHKDEFEVWRIRDGREDKSLIPNSELE